MVGTRLRMQGSRGTGVSRAEEPPASDAVPTPASGRSHVNRSPGPGCNPEHGGGLSVEAGCEWLVVVATLGGNKVARLSKVVLGGGVAQVQT